MANQQDNKNRTLLIGIAAIGVIVLIAAGLIIWALNSGSNEKVGTGTPYETITPTKEDTSNQPGQIAIDPVALQLASGPDGKLQGVATVSALFQDFTFQTVTVRGAYAANLLVKSDRDCASAGKSLITGGRCAITITYSDNGSPPTAAQAGESPPSLYIVGESKSPGGQTLIVEASAAISGTLPNGVQIGTPSATAGAAAPGGQLPTGPLGPDGQPIAVAGGPVAPNGVAPYGQPSPITPSAGAGTAPPVDYSQAPAGGGASVGGGGQQQQRLLTPREQFILARRQAVLGNIQVRNAQTGQPVSTGDWDEIKVPKAVSSAQQDMSRVVTMDRIITAVLSRPFDSRSSQQVVAQVDRNVYGANGRNILIPRGSTVIGTATGGGERVAINWTQIIRPDGARFVMKATAGDAMGQADVPGRVNNRYLARFGSILLGSLVKAGTAVATNAQQPQGDGFGGSAGQNNGAIVTGIVTQDINSIVQELVKNRVQPIITVPTGTRLTIVPQQDLVLREVERPTVVRPSYPRMMNGGAAAPAFQVQTPQQNGQQDQGYAPAPAQNGYAPAPSGGYQAPQPSNANPAPVLSQRPPSNLGATPPWSSN